MPFSSFQYTKWLPVLLLAENKDVETFEERFPMEVQRDVWFRMIRDRFWSTFSPFSEAQLELGIKELADASQTESFSFAEVELLVVATA